MYSNTGTFNIRQTVMDHWDRAASATTSVTVASMTGRRTSSFTGGVYNLVQSGPNITGTFTAPSGATSNVSGNLSPQAFTTTGPDPGRISLSLPLLIGSTIVTATFAGTLPGDGDTNCVLAPVSGAGLGGKVVVTLIRQ